MTKVNTRLGEIEKDVAEFRKELTAVKDDQVIAARERQQFKVQADGLEEKITSNTTNVKSATMAEVNHRAEKRRNVVVFGMKESASAAPADRIRHDRQQFTELMESIGVPVEIAEATQRNARLGKPVNNQNRPMLVTLQSEVDKDRILDKARVLRTKAGSVSIKPDLTEMQRDDDRKLREEVDKLNVTNPQDKDGPFHWKVSGKPGFLRKTKVKGLAPVRDQPRRVGRPRKKSKRNHSDVGEDGMEEEGGL